MKSTELDFQRGKVKQVRLVALLSEKEAKKKKGQAQLPTQSWLVLSKRSFFRGLCPRRAPAFFAISAHPRRQETEAGQRTSSTHKLKLILVRSAPDVLSSNAGCLKKSCALWALAHALTLDTRRSLSAPPHLAAIQSCSPCSLKNKIDKRAVKSTCFLRWRFMVS
jgi:hypothetical protein